MPPNGYRNAAALHVKAFQHKPPHTNITYSNINISAILHREQTTPQLKKSPLREWANPLRQRLKDTVQELCWQFLKAFLDNYLVNMQSRCLQANKLACDTTQKPWSMSLMLCELKSHLLLDLRAKAFTTSVATLASSHLV